MQTYYCKAFLSVWDHVFRNNTTLDCTEVWGIKDVEAPAMSHAQMLTGFPAVRDSRVTMHLYNLSRTDICKSTIETRIINTNPHFLISCLSGILLGWVDTFQGASLLPHVCLGWWAKWAFRVWEKEASNISHEISRADPSLCPEPFYLTHAFCWIGSFFR